jgi:hypothetical protein
MSKCIVCQTNERLCLPCLVKFESVCKGNNDNNKTNKLIQDVPLNEETLDEKKRRIKQMNRIELNKEYDKMIYDLYGNPQKYTKFARNGKLLWWEA